MQGPFRVKVLVEVRSDILFDGLVCKPGEHDAWCNDFGAVSVNVDGKALGLRPDEFEYVTWPPTGVPLAVTPQTARKMIDERDARIRELEALDLANTQAITNMCEGDHEVDAYWAAQVVKAAGTGDVAEIVALIEAAKKLPKDAKGRPIPNGATVWEVGRVAHGKIAKLEQFVCGQPDEDGYCLAHWKNGWGSMMRLDRIYTIEAEAAEAAEAAKEQP